MTTRSYIINASGEEDNGPCSHHISLSSLKHEDIVLSHQQVAAILHFAFVYFNSHFFFAVARCKV